MDTAFSEDLERLRGREMVEEDARIRVSCRDCSFERILSPDGDAKPADILIEHGQRTGHTLTVSRVEE